MNRLAGIIVAAVGLIVAVLGALKIVPGITGSGVALILLGGLIIGLSFVNKPEENGTERMSTPSTLGNIFISPGEVFRNLRRHPRWLVAVIIMVILSATYTNLFLYRIGPDKVTNYAIDKTLAMPMLANNEAARNNIEAGRAQAIADAKNPVVRSAQVASTFTGVTVLNAILAVILFLVAIAMGGSINFWQAFTVAVYASFPLSVLRFILNTTILFLKDPSDIHPILGQSSLIQDNLNFLVLPAEHPVLFTLLGSLSLLYFYWIWMLATGMKNGGERISGSIAWSAAFTVYFLLVIVGVIAAFLFPTFIS